MIVNNFNHRGYLELSFAEFCEELNTERWFPLYSKFNEEIDGMVCLSLDVNGPGHKLCNACSIFIGDGEVMYYKDKPYHTKCGVCVDCLKSLHSEIIYERNNLIYCNLCHDRNFGENETIKSAETATLPKIITAAWGCETNDSPHDWVKNNFKTDLFSCGFCGDYLWGSTMKKKDGYSCSLCNFNAHGHCKPHVPSNCTRDTKNTPVLCKMPTVQAKEKFIHSNGITFKKPKV
eukprot:TRINITY_DN3819_c0_g1_i1.p1 TRINITY_DN3819_c0_g1~~TRINITY_DN3819_c0_g1_i1.p1  ORF type:complete len:233 (-),score=30.52 TRINITY_DN3819_c0_g1_i1:57-755(-)